MSEREYSMKTRHMVLMVIVASIVLASQTFANGARDTVDAGAGHPLRAGTKDESPPSEFRPPLLITLACSLGSGIAGALIVAFYNARSEGRRGRVDYLRSEIHELYGPLKFLVASNQNIYRHVSKLEAAGLQEYGGENWNKYARDHTEKGIDATISVENLYFDLTRANVKCIIEILSAN